MEKSLYKKICRCFTSLGLLLFYLCISQVEAQTPSGNVLFVKETGSGNGSSWEDAFNGVDLAAYLRGPSIVDSIKIYIAEGIYIPYRNGIDNPTDPSAYYFEIKKQGIEIHGGYSNASTGTNLSNRNPKNYVTRLSGEIQNDNDSTNNSYHVVLIANGESAIISGLYISDGYADGSDDFENGGGILDLGGGGLVRISQTIIENNAADYGGGVYFYGNAKTILDSVIVRNNKTLIDFGGAIFAWGDFALLNSTVSGNNDGVVSWGGDIGIRNSTITNNNRHGVFAQNTQLNDVRVALVSTTITNNGNTGVRLNNKKPGAMHLTFNNNLVINNTTNINFSSSSGTIPIDTLLFQYSIVGNTKYATNVNDKSILSTPVTLGPLADNGGWSETQKLLDNCYNPAVNAGDTALLRKPDAKYDQRGVLRSNPPAIGAYDGVHGFQIGLTVTPNDTVCENIAVAITATVSIPSDLNQPGYQWYKDNTVIPGETGNIFGRNSIKLANAGKYKLLVTTEDPNCFRMSDSVILTINPAYKDSTSIAICQGESYDFRGQVLSLPGLYGDTLATVNGCDSVFLLNLLVNPLPSVSAVRTNDSICSDTNQTINIETIFGITASNGGDSLTFSRNTAFTGLISNPSGYTINSGGDSTIYVQAVNKTTNCISPTYLTLHYKVNVLPAIHISVVGKDTAVCSNSAVNFDLTSMATATNGGDLLEYSESKSFTTILSSAEAMNYIANPRTKSVIYIRAINTTTSCTSAGIDSLIIYIGADPAGVSTQPQSSVYGDTGQLTVMAIGIWPKYQWYKDGNILTGNTSTVCPITGVGEYYAKITNPCGSINSDTAKISKATLTVTAHDDSTSYGFDPAAYTGNYDITGFVNNENVTVLTSQPTVVLSGDITQASLPGIYPGAIIAQGAGADNYNFNYQYGTLTILDTSTDITSIIVDGQTAISDNDTAFHIMAECNVNSAEIYVSAGPNVTVMINGVPENPYTYTMDRYGKSTIVVEVTAQSGNTQAYSVTINKPIPPGLIFIKRWQDVLTVPVEFEGIVCTKVEWYEAGSTQPLPRSTDKGYLRVEETGEYYAVINDTLTTCVQEVYATQIQSKAYPNPVSPNQTITIETGLSDDERQGATISIVNVQGRVWSKQNVGNGQVYLRTPNLAGTYIIRIRSGHETRDIKIIVNKQ